MSDYSVADFVEAARRRQRDIAASLAEMRGLRAKHEERRKDLAERRERAYQELVTALLPDLSQAARERAARAVGYPALLADPRPAIEEERRDLEARLGHIERDPRFADREALRAPGTGRLVMEIEDLESNRRPLVAVLARAAHPRLERLLEVGYGTPAYDVPFWRLSYYADWKAGDEVLERFPQEQDFAALRSRLLPMIDAVKVYDAKLAGLRAEVAAGEELEAEHRETRGLLETAVPRALDRARKALAAHVRELEPGALPSLAAEAPEAVALYKRASGLEHQLRYLEQIIETQVVSLERSLSEESQKLEHDIVKYQRPKRASTRFDRAAFERRFAGRTQKCRHWIDRSARTHDTVYGFTDYGRVRLATDFLWWDAITGGRIDGDFIPEVRAHHELHPEARRERDMEAAAAASVGADRELGGGAGSADIS